MRDFDNFRDFINNFGNYAWSVAAVKAPIDQVTTALSAMLGKQPILNAKFEPSKMSEEMGQYITILQTNDSLWTVLYFSLGQWINYTNVEIALSKDLNTLVLQYSAEDTSGVEGMTLFENGIKINEFLTGDDSEYLDGLMEEVYEDHEDGEEEYKKWQREQESAVEIVDSYGEVFARLGIETVNAYPTANGTVAIKQ